MRVTPVFATAGLILVAASATACSGGSTPGAATSPASAAVAGASAPAGSAAPKNFDVCSALPASMASQITGTKFSKTKSSDAKGIVFGCEYDGPNSALLQISVEMQYGKDEFDTDVSALKQVGHAPDAVSGVGDEAFSEPNPNGNAGAVGAASAASYGAVFGGIYISIGGLTYVTAAQGKQIVEELHSKL